MLSKFYDKLIKFNWVLSLKLLLVFWFLIFLLYGGLVLLFIIEAGLSGFDAIPTQICDSSLTKIYMRIVAVAYYSFPVFAVPTLFLHKKKRLIKFSYFLRVVSFFLAFVVILFLVLAITPLGKFLPGGCGWV